MSYYQVRTAVQPHLLLQRERAVNIVVVAVGTGQHWKTWRACNDLLLLGLKCIDFDVKIEDPCRRDYFVQLGIHIDKQQSRLLSGLCVENIVLLDCIVKDPDVTAAVV